VYLVNNWLEYLVFKINFDSSYLFCKDTFVMRDREREKSKYHIVDI